MSIDPDRRFPDGRGPRRFYEAGGDGEGVFTLQRLDHKTYRVTTQFDYVDGAETSYRVPADVADNSTDLASVPGVLTWLVPKDGRHTPAAVLHDALIGGRSGVDYVVSHGNDVTERHADYVFREAMHGLGVGWLRRWMMWAAVALRTLTRTSTPKPGASTTDWTRVGLIGALVVPWTVLCAVLALDVPDLSSQRVSLPWLGARPLLDESLSALGTIVVGTAALAGLFGMILTSVRGVAAGAIAGLTIGFLALPMLAGVVGYLIYFVLETSFTAMFDRDR